MSMKMRLASVSAAVLLTLCCTAGCGNGSGGGNTDTPQNESPAASAAEGGAEQTAESAAESTDDTSEEKKEVNMEIRDIPSKELLKEIKIGWNLGNTMDATGDPTLGAETHWQTTTTSVYMFELLKDTGFDIVRIPVSWGEHMDSSYKVDPEWMARVHEIVDYGINNGLYVILNTHHENWYMPTEEDMPQDLEQLKALWEQIAEEFKGYDEHLIFEGVNEPRLRDTPLEWSGGTPGSRKVVAEYAKTFYETVRASGGNNAKRHLMLTGYAAASRKDCLQDIWLPDGDDKVIVSVHAYLPYNFALNVKGTDKWSIDKDTGEIDNFFKDLDELFVSKDIPVIVGEFGVLNKDNLEDRIACTEYYISKARELGIPCLWWDNNSVYGNGENFGIMDRSMIPVWRYQRLTDAIIKAAKG